MVISDCCTKVDIHLYIAIQTLKGDEVATKNMVIPDFYTNVDIYPYFAIQSLKGVEFLPKHGYSWFLSKC